VDRLLIGAMGKVIYWDGAQAHTVFDAQGERAYGITWDEDRIFVAVGRKKGKILIFDGQWRMQGEVQVYDGSRDTHQMLWWKGTLYIAEPGREAIIRYKDGKTDRIGWQQRFCERREKPHVNSIWCDGIRFYVVEHWRRQLPKKVQVLDLNWKPLGALVIDGEVLSGSPSNGIHNVYVEDGHLYTLGPGRLIRLNLESDEASAHQIEWSPWPYYLRGLARTDDAFYVGMSQFESVRTARARGQSAFAVMDDALDVVEVVMLRGAGQIHEIRALSGDRAHNGIDCPFRG
jgi:hypothetical protein